MDTLVDAIRKFPGVTRKNTIRDVVKFLPTSSFVNVVASEGEDAAVIDNGENDLLLAADGIMESLLKTNPFYAGYFAVLVNVNDIAAMGGKPLAMVDIMSVKDEKVCSQMLKGMERAVKKFNVPIVGGHTHPDCQYQAIDIAILGSVPKGEVILSSEAQPGDDIVFVMDTDGFYPPELPYAYDTTTNKEDRLVQDQMAVMCQIAKEKLVHSGKDMSNPGCIGTTGMLLETSDKGGYIDVGRIPVPRDVDFIQWVLSYQGCGFTFACPPENSARVIELFKKVQCDGAVVGKVDETKIMKLRSGDEEKILFDFSKDVITGCSPHKK